MCVPMKTSEQPEVSLLWHNSPFFFSNLRQSHSLAWNSPRRLGWPAGFLQELACFPWPTSGMASADQHAGFLR